MAPKTQQLQIRVSPAEKRALRQLAHAAGLDLSSYVLARALPAHEQRFLALVRALRDEATQRPTLAAVHDLLHDLSPSVLEHLPAPALDDVPRWAQNYVAALIELAADRAGVTPPAWVAHIQPPTRPHFATSLKRLHRYLLVAAPVAFKRRNIFTDTGLGSRV